MKPKEEMEEISKDISFVREQTMKPSRVPEIEIENAEEEIFCVKKEVVEEVEKVEKVEEKKPDSPQKPTWTGDITAKACNFLKTMTNTFESLSNMYYKIEEEAEQGIHSLLKKPKGKKIEIIPEQIKADKIGGDGVFIRPSSNNFEAAMNILIGIHRCINSMFKLP